MRLANVGYAFSDELIEACNKLPRIKGRASLCADLIEAYGLTQHMRILQPQELSIDQLANFHSRDYLEAFQQVCEQDDPEKIDKDIVEEYGLGYDCPVEQGLFERCALIAGATVCAAEALVAEDVRVAINWCGGWHHAKRFEAAGFCYINDIVLAAQKLREKFERVLYVDLDLHHGDGVEEAFYTTNRVYTLSIHKFSPGFYPGTGRLKDIGQSNGSYYTQNVPLKDGVTSEQFTRIFTKVFGDVVKAYQPSAIICQCGADGLAMDEMDSFNLSSCAYTACVRQVLDCGLPTLLLGGGGYNYPNTSRTWCLLTASALDLDLPNDIPSDIESFMSYKPDFELKVPAGNRPNDNKDMEIDELLRVVEGCVNMISSSKST